MLGIVIGGIIAILTIYIFLCPNKATKDKPKSINKKPQNPKKEEKKEIIPKKVEKEEPKIDISKYLIKTIKECNNMSKCYFYKKGHLILFCDEKKLSLCHLKNFLNDSPKIYSKTIEKDLIVDICLSPEKKTVFCANKNSKSILFYVLDKVDGKIKLVKQDKTIICNRPFEIKSIVSDEAGSLLCSIGTNDDTEIQIFDPISSELKFKESTSAIQNLQMLMGPNDNDLLISTFMNDISVLNFEKSDKFNNETKKYENIFKFKRTSSIPVKARPIFYALSNNEKFFVVACDDKSVKIFRNYGNISESKIYTKINLDFDANCVGLFVEDFDGKLEGYTAIGRGNDILIYKIEGENSEKILELNDAHNGEILGLHITKEDEDDKKNKELILISAGKDGRIKIWKI